MKTLSYIFTQDSILRAFKGPAEPNEKEFSGDQWKYNNAVQEWRHVMSTALESALPVVNASCMCKYESEALLFYIDKERIKIGPGETVPLPGWELKEVRQVTKKGNEAKEAYRLVRSEPVKKEPIKLTFKSNSLWHGEYQVVNPEVIPITPDGYSTRIKDGDQITLPEGYGIEEREEVNTPEGWKSVNCFYGLDRKRGEFRTVATITLPEKPKECKNSDDCSIDKGTCDWPTCVGQEKPKKYEHFPQLSELSEFESEKPENSAHGDTEGSKQFDIVCFNCNATNASGNDRCTNCDAELKPVVEPSESQEDMWGYIINDTRWYDGSPAKYRSLLKHLKEKFTITRK